MRKYKMLAVMMAVTMVGSIYSPVQAAGYCANTNGSNCQIIVGGNCLNGNSVKGASDNNCNNSALVKDILSNSSCNSGNSVKGASDSGSCSNEALVKNILNNINCNNGNSVKGESDNSNCKSGNCTDTGSNSCNSGKCSVTNNNCNSANGGSCLQNGKVYKIVVGNGCQSVTRNTTKQPSIQVTDPSTEQSEIQVTTEQPTTEKSVAEKPSTEQSSTEKPVAEKPSTEQPSAGQEKTTEEKTEEKSDVTKPENPTADDMTYVSMSEDQGTAAASVLNLVNQNRLSAGLHSLKLDSSLCQAAQIRANEIVSSFSHTRPDGRKFSTVLTDNGIRFTAAGENIAWGQRSAEEVMSAWMNSDGHRANIMNQTYTKLGVGHVTVNGRQYWVQLFSY